MDIDVVYTAKDGRRFNDPYECEEYEKRLGTEAGTVARARIDLKELGEDRYAFGLLKVRHENVNYYRTYVVQCIDDKLEDYVNVSELDVDKRWIRNTIGDVLSDMEQFNDDFEKAKEIARELKLKAQFPDSEIAMAARRPGVTGLGMKFEYPDGTVRDKWGNIINDEEE